MTCYIEILGHSNAINCLSFNSGFLFTGSDDNSVAVWNSTTAEIIHRYYGSIYNVANS
jgi:WD40 repeat protein